MEFCHLHTVMGFSALDELTKTFMMISNWKNPLNRFSMLAWRYPSAINASDKRHNKDARLSC